MGDSLEWAAADKESSEAHQFRRFKQDNNAPAGEKGLWAILDGVARQAGKPEAPRKPPEPDQSYDFQQSFAASSDHAGAASAAAGFLEGLGSQSSATAPPLPESPAPRQAAPVERQNFAHLFRRQSEEVSTPQAEGTSLSALFNRLSSP